jgi:hypothetical protein
MKPKDLNSKKEPRPEYLIRLQAWSILVSVMLSVWVFAVYLGPWLEGHIPMMAQIVKVIEEQDINANAYFYTEIEASSEGEQFLRGSFEHSGRDDYGVTLPFISGVLLCFLILFFGYWFMPS